MTEREEGSVLGGIVRYSLLGALKSERRPEGEGASSADTGRKSI